MAGPDTTLHALLAAERACCARLEAILDAERSAAAAYDHAGLLACLKEREALDAEWQAAAAERRHWVASRRTSLAGIAAADREAAALLADIRQMVLRVRRAQRINEGLVRAALAHVTELLTVIQRALPENRYDRSAALAPPAALGRGAGWSA